MLVPRRICLFVCLFVCLTPFIERVNAQDGDISCDPGNGFKVTWYDTVGTTCRAVCEPDYGFGSVPVIYDDSPDVSGDIRVGEVNTPIVYPNTSYHLLGAYVWFETGYWWFGTWHQTGSTQWCYYEAPGGSCFVGETPILTPAGSKAIDQLLVGDRILVRDSDKSNSDDTRAGTIKRVHKSVSSTLKVNVGNQLITLTANHPLFVRGKGWTPASKLEIGDQLIGNTPALQSVFAINKGEDRPVFNLEVEKGDNGYFVGSESWGFSVWAFGACKRNSRRTDVKAPSAFDQRLFDSVSSKY